MLPTPPSGIQTLPLDWFRGLDLRFKSDLGSTSSAAVDATVLMLRPVLNSPAAVTRRIRAIRRSASHRSLPENIHPGHPIPPTNRPQAGEVTLQACEVEFFRPQRSQRLFSLSPLDGRGLG